jgi:hypothetical protein
MPPRDEAASERPAETFVPRSEPKVESVTVEAQPSLALNVEADAAPAPRAAPRRRATSAAAAATRFAEAAGGEAPEFLTRPVRRPRREAPAADAADAPAAPVEKPVSE